MGNSRYYYEHYLVVYVHQGKKLEKKVIIRESNHGPRWIPKNNFLRAKADFSSKHLHDEVISIIFLEE